MNKETIVSFIRFHALAIAAALAAAFIVVSPLVVFPHYAGAQYQGINIMRFDDDEQYYLSRMKEALEGHPLGQPFLAEGKQAQDPTFSYVERAFAVPFLVTGTAESIDVVTFYNILNAASVFLLILLIYIFALRLTEDRAISIGIALMVVCGDAIIQAKTLFFPELIGYGRSLFPFASSVPFFAFLIALYDSVIRWRGWRSEVLAGVFFGVLFYDYLFAWTFAAAFLGALFWAYVYMRDWRALRSVCLIAGIGVGVGAYNVVRLFLFYSSQLGTQLSYFLFSLHSHAPVMSWVGVGTFSLAALYSWRVRADRNMPLVWSLIAAGWIALNQQVLTGRVVQYGHYYWYFIVPLSIVLGGVLVWRLLPVRLRFPFACALIAIALVNGAGEQYRAFHSWSSVNLADQTYAPIIAGLKRSPPGVVLAGAGGESEPFLVTIYTDDDLYWLPAAALHVFPVDRLEEALLMHLYLNKDAHSDPSGYLRNALAPGKENEYADMYETLEGYQSGLEYYTYRNELASGEQSFGGLRERLLQELATRYKTQFASTAEVSALLKERGVRYVLWDSTRYPEWDMASLGKTELIVQSGTVYLYELKN